MDAVVYKLNNKSKKLEFAAANNSFYIIKNNELIIAKPDKMPVGISDNDAVPFTHNEISLSEGDIIYTFTDGYADQFGGPTGKKYKYKKFLELLYSGKNNQLSQQKIKIESEFKSWKGHLEQIDDVCVIGIRV
jgi:serine phosphatase RsbU (regulator of sigma subunit)